jgi:hypothetical protein
MASLEIPAESETDDASRALKIRVARMVKWQSRTLAGLALVVLLFLIRIALEYIPQADVPLAPLFALVPVCVLLAAFVAGVTTVVAGVILVCQIFRVAYLAFGIWSALMYTGLMLTLTSCLFLPGLFVVPQMVRLDVKRSLGIDLDADQAV